METCTKISPLHTIRHGLNRHLNETSEIDITRGTPKKLYSKFTKTITAFHFVQYDVFWSTEK